MELRGGRLGTLRTLYEDIRTASAFMVSGFRTGASSYTLALEPLFQNGPSRLDEARMMCAK